MALLKTKTLLERDKTGLDGQRVFTASFDDVVHQSVYLGIDTDEDFGNPDEITVTIQPGRHFDD